MAPHSASLLSPDGPLNEEIMEDITREDRFQKKPTNLTEVVKHLPDDVFEKRPFRAYMAALQVRNNIIFRTIGAWRSNTLEPYGSILTKHFFAGDCPNGCIRLCFISYRKLPWDCTRLVCCRDMCYWDVCDRA